jgi:hypothetical protein
MNEVLVAFLLALDNMLNHAGATTSTAPDQVACVKGPEQGFGLIEPGDIHWGEQHLFDPQKLQRYPSPG